MAAESHKMDVDQRWRLTKRIDVFSVLQLLSIIATGVWAYADLVHDNETTRQAILTIESRTSALEIRVSNLNEELGNTENNVAEIKANIENIKDSLSLLVTHILSKEK